MTGQGSLESYSSGDKKWSWILRRPASRQWLFRGYWIHFEVTSGPPIWSLKEKGLRILCGYFRIFHLIKNNIGHKLTVRTYFPVNLWALELQHGFFESLKFSWTYSLTRNAEFFWILTWVFSGIFSSESHAL